MLTWHITTPNFTPYINLKSCNTWIEQSPEFKDPPYLHTAPTKWILEVANWRISISDNRYLVSPAGKTIEVQHLEAEESYRLPPRARLIIYFNNLPVTWQIRYHWHPLNQGLDLLQEDMLNKGIKGQLIYPVFLWPAQSRQKELIHMVPSGL